MAIPATTQDFVHGVDFTGATAGTAAQHNQLVDLAIPYTDGADEGQGIGFMVVTTDTALNTPSVPNPESAAGYNKWRRYLWVRRPYASATSQVPQAYMWIPAVTLDGTYRKWILLDPSSYTTTTAAYRTITDGNTSNGSPTLQSASQAGFTSADVGKYVTGTNIPANTTITAYTSATSVTMSNNATGANTTVVIKAGTGTPLQIALDWANTQAASAVASASAANSTATTLQTKVGTVGATDLQTQVNNTVTVANTATSNLALVYNKISGSTTDLDALGGMNALIASLQTALTSVQTSAHDPTQLIGPANGKSGSLVRWNANVESSSPTPKAEWFDPADTTNEVLTSSLTGTLNVTSFTSGVSTALGALTGTATLPIGVWLITGFVAFSIDTQANGATVTATVKTSAGSIAGLDVYCGSDASAGGYSFTIPILGVLTVTKASGVQTLSVEYTVTYTSAPSSLKTNGKYVQLIARRIALCQG